MTGHWKIPAVLPTEHQATSARVDGGIRQWWYRLPNQKTLKNPYNSADRQKDRKLPIYRMGVNSTGDFDSR